MPTRTDPDTQANAKPPRRTSRKTQRNHRSDKPIAYTSYILVRLVSLVSLNIVVSLVSLTILVSLVIRAISVCIAVLIALVSLGGLGVLVSLPIQGSHV